MSAKKNRADRDLNRDGFKSYPEEIPIYPTHEEFPANGTLISNCFSSFKFFVFCWVTLVNLFNAMNVPIGILARPFINNNINT
jgi:hypothetical protein